MLHCCLFIQCDILIDTVYHNICKYNLIRFIVGMFVRQRIICDIWSVNILLQRNHNAYGESALVKNRLDNHAN